MLDTIEISKKLQASGLTQKQSEAIAQSMLEIPEWTNLATKADLGVIHAEMGSLRAELAADITRAKYDLIYWVIGVFIITNIVQVATSFMHR